MEQIIKIQDLPETLDMQELMEVKGGNSANDIICSPGTSAVWCDPKSLGVIIIQPPTQSQP